MPDRSSEFDIALGVMRYLILLPTGRASISVIKGRLSRYASLTEEDRLPSPTRKGEMVWEQQVRNLVSHRRMRGNAIYDGYLGYEGRGILFLTEAGKDFIRVWDEHLQESQKKPGC